MTTGVVAVSVAVYLVGYVHAMRLVQRDYPKVWWCDRALVLSAASVGALALWPSLLVFVALGGAA